MRPQKIILFAAFLIIVLLLAGCINADQQLAGLTPIPSLAPGATETLLPALQSQGGAAQGATGAGPGPPAIEGLAGSGVGALAAGGASVGCGGNGVAVGKAGTFWRVFKKAMTLLMSWGYNGPPLATSQAGMETGWAGMPLATVM